MQPSAQRNLTAMPPADGEGANPLAALLTARIRSGGPIPFAEFMRECLYHPTHGYYSRIEGPRFRDYYTSVDVHPIFGRLLARQLAEMWELLGAPRPFLAIEAGAGAGTLARQILDFAESQLPEFYEAAQYVAVERSARRRAAQLTALAAHIAAGHFSGAAELPSAIPCGCIFSNELIDAFPVHRVVMEAGRLQETYVGLEGEDFRESVGPPSTPALERYFREQGIALPEGHQTEVCLEACRWIQEAGSALRRGFALTIDYGHEAQLLYSEEHNRGTLLAYRGHQVSENVLDAPGEQDLTAHVNFTALDVWGRRAALERTGLVTQSHFLTALGRANEFGDLYELGQSEVEKLRARLLLKNLIHPEGLGEVFQALIQHKGITGPRLTGLSGL